MALYGRAEEYIKQALKNSALKDKVTITQIIIIF